MTSNGTPRTSSSAQLSLLAKLVQLYVRSRLRGSTRLTYLLAQRFGSLQHVPLEIPGWAPVYVDLRLSNAHFMVMESPYKGLWRELDEVEIMRQFVRAGDVAFDIGANVGLHSILLSRLVGPQGKLCAFEPNAELLHALEFTIEQLGNATLYPIALSNKDADSQLFIPPDDTVASLADWTIASPKFNQDGPSHVIACVERRLDDLIQGGVLPQPDFIKCDVEGAELRVFQGAHNTLNRVDAPIVLFEANECASRGFDVGVSAAKDFLAALQTPHYRFSEIHEGGRLVAMQDVNPNFSNILAVPESKC
jgi:FkbM family methyltransferase